MTSNSVSNGAAGESPAPEAPPTTPTTPTHTRPGNYLRRRDSYPVRLPVFEGPLDLLVHLIRTHKIEITDIPIAQVTEQYLGYLALMEALDLEVAGEFLVMAATLMEIKSRMLLPRPDPPITEEDGIDPRQELVDRLLEYERFQQVAEQLREMAAESSRSFGRGTVEQWEGAVPLIELRPGDLLDAIKRLTEVEDPEEAERKRAPLRVRRQAVNLQQRIGEIFRRVLSSPEPVRFSTLVVYAGRRLPRPEVLVIFLAVLELVRQNKVTAWQEGVLGDIILILHPEHAEAVAALQPQRDAGETPTAGTP